MRNNFRSIFAIIVMGALFACSGDETEQSSSEPVQNIQAPTESEAQVVTPIDAIQEDVEKAESNSVDDVVEPTTAPIDAVQEDVENTEGNSVDTVVKPATTPIDAVQEDLEKAEGNGVDDVVEPVTTEKDDSITELSILDISERSYAGGNALAVTFNIPINGSKNLSEHLVTTKEGEGIVDGTWELSESGKIVYFPQIDPVSNYSVQVYQGLEAVNGQKLKRTKKEKVATREVKPSFTFASKGSFLPLELHTGLPVTSVNVPEVDVNYHRAKPQKLHQLLNSLSQRTQSYNRYSLKRLEEETDFVYSSRYTLEGVPNKRKDFNLPIQDIEVLREPGVYIAVMSEPGVYYDQVQVTYFTVTDLGLHLRVYDDQIDAHVSSLKTAMPVANVELMIVDNQGLEVDVTRTTSQGLATIKNKNNKGRYVLAKLGKSISLVELKGPALDLSEFELGKRLYRTHDLFMYGPRDLYRPGEIAQFSALLRDDDGSLSKTVPLQAKIKSPDGTTVKNFSWRQETIGYYSYEYNIPTTAKTGTWSLQVRNTDGSDSIYSFKVEEFLPERMKLSFNSGLEEKFYSAKEPVVVNVLGEYLYGAPASGNRFKPTVRVEPQRFPFPQLKDFEFGDVKEEGLKQNYDIKEVKLDASGKARVEIKSKWKKLGSPLSVTLQGSLFESGGRPVTRRHISTVWPKTTAIGIRPGFKDKNPTQNSNVSFEVLKANAKGEKLAADNLEVSLIREDRRYFWEFSSREGWHYEFTDREYPELTKSLSIKKGQTADISVPVEWGSYRIEVRDPEQKTKSSVRFYAGYNWYENWQNNRSAEQAARPDKVSLALDKQHYLEGEIATLGIVPPSAGEALILVESDRPLFTKRISIPKEGMKIEIPVEKDWNRHDLYISVMHLQAANTKQKITPTRAFGLLHLPLNRESRHLDVEIKVDEKIVPNQKYMAKIKVSDINNTDSVYVTLAAVDVGVLSITNFETPNPFTYFFEPRRYQVDSRDMYQNLIELNANDVARQRFGGDAELSRGGENAQAEVQIVSLFSGLVSVNENGDANIPLDIPDFNGRLRLMAVAFSEDSFGHSDKEMTVAAPLVTQLAMPRFLAMGDKSTFALDVHNLTESDQTLEVKLSSTAPVFINNGETQIELAKGEKKTLLYPVEAAYTLGRSEVNLQINGVDEYPVNRNWGLQTRSAYPALTQTKAQLLKKGEEFVLEQEALQDFIPESVQAVIRMNNIIDLNIQEQLGQLLRYPYGCLEQSTSSTYPWLFATDANLEQMGIVNKTKKSRMDSIESGMKRIVTKQLSNGGYGLWSNTDSESQWLTAYVGDFLTDAREQGVTVSDEQYNKTMGRLSEYLNKTNGNFGHPWSDSSGHYQLAYRAYAGYVLSRMNRANLSNLRSMADRDTNEAKSFLPLLHLGLALVNQGDSQKGEEVLDKAFTLDRGDKYYADYGSNIRDQALAIHLLLKHKIRVDQASVMGAELAKALQGRNYLSTQERNSIFLAGLALETHFANEWQADIQLQGVIQALKYRGGFARKYESQELSSGIKVTNQGESDLFVDVAYLGYGSQAPAPQRSKNLSIARNYFDTKGRPLDPSTLTVGDLVLVRLDLSTQWRTPDVMVVDLLPAGLELENQNLDNAVKMDEIEFEGQKMNYWYERNKVVHQEYRDDRYVAAIDANYGHRSYQFYLARAVTPGIYKVPPPFVEDMYRPEDRAVGSTIESITIVNK